MANTKVNTTVFKANGTVATGSSLADANAKAKAQETSAEDKPKAVESPERFSAEYDEATQTLTLHVKMHKEGAPRSKAGKSLSLNLFNRKVAGWTFSFNGYYKLEDQDQDNGDGFKLSIKK